MNMTEEFTNSSSGYRVGNTNEMISQRRTNTLESQHDEMIDEDSELLNLTELEDKEDVIPVTKRRCTDICFLVTFLVYLLGMALVAVVGFSSGNPERLVYGTDYQGIQCGGDVYPTLKRIAYPRIEEDILMSGYLSDIPGSITSGDSISFFGVCVATCPSAGDYVCTQEAEDYLSQQPASSRDTIIYECLSGSTSCPSATVRKGCFEMLFDTADVLMHCLPEYVYQVEELPESGCLKFKNITDSNGNIQTLCVQYMEVTKVTRVQPTGSNVLLDAFNTYAVWANNCIGDISRSYDVILYTGGGMTILVGILYLLSLWMCVGIVVWVSVLGSIAGSCALTVYCYVKAGIITSERLSQIINSIVGAINSAVDDSNEIIGWNITKELKNVTANELPISPSSNRVQQYTIAAYVLTAFTVILFVVVLMLVGRIMRAMKIFSQASKAIRHNMSLLILPFLSTFFMIGVIAGWLYTLSYVASAGTIEFVQVNTTYSVDPDAQIFEVAQFGPVSYRTLFIVYMCFGLLWILAFLNGLSVMVSSSVILEWYFGDRSKRARFPIIRMFMRTARYHLGTIAFGSFLVALLSFIRYVAAYMQRQVASWSKKNKVLKYLLWILQCCLLCIQKLVEFISKNGLIVCSMYGGSFCTSTRQAFNALASNIVQVALVTFLGDIIQRFGQIMITVFSGIVCWTVIDGNPEYGFGGDKELNSTLVPVTVTMLMSWYIAAEILSVYDITVDTILMAYCQDKRLGKLKDGYKTNENPEMEKFVKENELHDEEEIQEARKFTVM